MNGRQRRLLAEAAEPPQSKAEIMDLAKAELKKAGVKFSGKMHVSRSYGFGAEVQADVGTVGGDRVWLEVTLSYDRDATEIELRRRMGSHSTTFLRNAKEIGELHKLLGRLT